MKQNDLMLDEVSEDFSNVRIPDADREKAIGALKGLASVEKASPFAPKERQGIGRVKVATIKMLEDNGYDTNSAVIHQIVATFIDNLGRAFPA